MNISDATFIKKIKTYAGFLLAVPYGILLRVLSADLDIFNQGIIFLLILPAIIGLIPVYYASTGVFASKLKLFFYPFFTVFIILLISTVSNLQEFYFLALFGWPFFTLSGILGILVGGIVKEQNKKDVK